jgi:hypothetical protein
VRETLASCGSAAEKMGSEIALEIVERIDRNKIRDWRTNHDAINRFRIS